jgi:hypothetical protein
VAQRQDTDLGAIARLWPLLGLPFAVSGIIGWIHDPSDWAGKVFTAVGAAVYFGGLLTLVLRRRKRRRQSESAAPPPRSA